MDDALKAYDKSVKERDLSKPWGMTTPEDVEKNTDGVVANPENTTGALRDATRLQGLVPDVLDPMAPGVTTMDRGAEISGDTVRSDPEANRPLA